MMMHPFPVRVILEMAKIDHGFMFSNIQSYSGVPQQTTHTMRGNCIAPSNSMAFVKSFTKWSNLLNILA